MWPDSQQFGWHPPEDVYGNFLWLKLCEELCNFTANLNVSLAGNLLTMYAATNMFIALPSQAWIALTVATKAFSEFRMH
jgi:hypothetical protein